MPGLSTHVLDTANGRPAAGVALSLWRIDPGGGRRMMAQTLTNADGRTEQPLLSGESLEAGVYELEFRIGDYFRLGGTALPDLHFLDVVPIRFGIADPNGHYHVPLLVSPWSYSTYRGS